MSNKDNFELRRIFKSERSSINLIEPLLLEVKERLNLRDDLFYNIMIAVTEAVNNAINHGNKLNPHKNVVFSVIGGDNEIVISVKDEGEGFNPDALADCTDPSNLLKDSGRGVFIIRELMDKVDIKSNNQGTVITMLYYPNEH
jgi:serine/threonine-protein kinase RsbW